MEPVVVNLPVPGASRGVWAGQLNDAIEKVVGAINEMPDEVQTEVANQLASKGVLPTLDRVTLLKQSAAKMIVGHRGGVRIHPEHTLEGYRDCVRSGFLPEMDIRRLASGDLVCIHDATTGRTMSGTSATVSAMTLDDWKSRTVLSPWQGGKGGKPAMWEDVLDEFGGRTVLVAEIKDNAATADIIASIQRRGLQRQVILQSFTLSIAQQVANAGIAALFLCGATTTVTPKNLTDSKIEFLGPSLGMSATDIAAFQAAGIKVAPYTVETLPDWTALKAKGVDGAFFNDPWGATMQYERSSRDPFTTGEPFYGWAYWDNDNTPMESMPINYRSSQGGLFMNGMFASAIGGSRVLKQGWAKPITIPSSGGSLALRFRARLVFDDGGGGTSAAATRWIGVFIGNTPAGLAYNDNGNGAPNQAGYHTLFRRSGTIDLYKVASNVAPTKIGTLDTSPALAAANTVKETEVEIIINGSGIRVRRLDTGASISATDASGPRSNLELHLSMNGANGQWRDVSFEAIEPAYIGY